MRRWNVGIVGVTGAVGRAMAACLAESGLPVAVLRGYASERSVGLRLRASGPWGETIEVEPLEEGRLRGLDLVLLSAGAAVSRTWVPRAVAAGAWAVDNSSAWRMDPAVPLVVPEVNPEALPARRGAVANPNCSTIQMVVVLSPLARRFGLRRVHVATYQSVSGKGQKGIEALAEERAGRVAPPGVFAHPIDGNVLPHCDVFREDGFTREEEKMILETRKILSMPSLRVHPTCARVPVAVSHSEAVHVELERAVTREELLDCLAAAPGVRVADDPGRAVYPTPRDATGTNDVWVGRIRQDRTDPTVAELWVVADNLRKGAAWNAVQIACLLHAREGQRAGLPVSARL